MNLVDAAMLGHFHGGDFLPAASAAILVITLTNCLVLAGPCTAACVLSANAFGDDQKELAGQRLIASAVCTMFVSVCAAPIWWMAGDLLAPWSGGSIQASDVNLFARVRLCGTVANVLLGVVTRWLTGRKVVHPALIVSLVGAVANIILNYLFIYGCPGLWNGMGFVGSPIATALCRWFMLFSLWPLVKQEVLGCWPSTPFWGFFPARLGEMLELCVPLSVASLLQDGFWYMAALFALRIGPQQLATHSCMLQVIMILSAFLDGSLTATSTLVAHHVVRGHITDLLRLIKQVFLFMLSWCSVVALILLYSQTRLGRFFSLNEKVWELSGELSFVVGPVYMVAACIYLSIGVLEGIARPVIAIVANLFGIYGTGLLLSVYLGFYLSPETLAWWPYFDVNSDSGPLGAGCGLLGLWLGMACGFTVSAMILMTRLLCVTDWDAEVARARRLAGRGGAAEPAEEGEQQGKEEGGLTAALLPKSEHQAE